MTLAGVGCHRLADEPEEEIDLEALALDACERACTTWDTCDPERFAGMEPEDCMERCPTHWLLQEANQCASREVLFLRCIGELSCEEFDAVDAVAPGEYDFSLPCAIESYHSHPARCSMDAPFDLDEPLASPP